MKSDLVTGYEITLTSLIKALKDADDQKLRKSAENALSQIRGLGYETELRNKGINEVICWGIAFSEKRSEVVMH